MILTSPNWCDGAYGMSYVLTNANGDTVSSGSGTPGWSGCADTTALCLPAGCYDIVVSSAYCCNYGYGWSFGGQSGQAGTSAVGISVGGAICSVPGCTDSTAVNYNPVANVDDNSCIYPPANDDCANAIAMACGDTVVGSNVGASANAYLSGIGGPAIWYSVTGQGGDITVATCGTGFDTRLFVYDACGTTSYLAYNDDFCGLQSQTTFTSVAGTVYYIAALGYSSNTATGDITVSVTCAAPPVPGCTDSLACNYDPTATVDDSSCIMMGASPVQVNCWDVFTWNTTTCSWDTSGSQPAAPTGLACYETATFDASACAWVVSGTQPASPAQYSSSLISACGDFVSGPNATWTHVLVATTIPDGAVSQGAQSFTMNVTSLPAGGANFRVFKTTANGGGFFGNPIALTLGSNGITVPAVNFNRSVKFQFSSGAVEFDALTLNGVASSCNLQH